MTGDRASTRQGRWSVLGVFLGLAVIGALTIVPKVMGWNDGTRMATIQALVQHHTLSIEPTSFASVNDKVFIGGHFYSDKLATPQLLGAAVYWPIWHLGIRLAPDWNLAYYLVTLFTVKLFWLLGLVAFYGSLAFTRLDRVRRLWLTVALGIGTLVLSWSATFNNHSLAASWVAIAFWFLLRARNKGRVLPNLFLSGLFFGLAGSSDVPTMAFPAAFGLYVLLDRRLRRGTWAYVVALLIAVAPALAVNYAISGSLVPVQIVPRYFDFPGSPWNAEHLTGTGVNSGSFLGRYTTGMLVGMRGFLVYNPLSLLALPLMVREFVRRRRFASEALVIFLMSVVIVGYYCLASNNYGGDAYSIRWFVTMLPLWMFFLYPLLEGKGAWRWVVLGAFLAVSVPIAVIGAWNPWSRADVNPVPLLSNLKMAPDLARSLWAAITHS
ncbi:hypothetical protein [Raineyella fluvialis]|nr:hypothetical protein [Raineyella fluvialis]